jgi:DNA-binding cell septation regulator SpoVG
MKRISEVTFIPLKPNEKGLIGLASALYENAISLNCIGVYIRPDGELRLVFPNKILPNGKEINIYYPINNEVYESIKEAVINKYEEITAKILN